MFKDIEAIFFDLDGTLVDSAPDLMTAVNTMLAGLDLPSRNEEQIRDWVGNGADRLIHRALTEHMDGEASADLMATARPLFQSAYEKRLCVHSQLYPGVLEGLQALYRDGFKLACITNKPTRFALPLVEQTGIGDFFDTVIGGECTQRKKPDPDALLLGAERLGVEIQNGLMVGDSINDVLASRNAGCPVVAVPYGYNHGRDIREAKPDLVIDSILELISLLKKAA